MYKKVDVTSINPHVPPKEQEHYDLFWVKSFIGKVEAAHHRYKEALNIGYLGEAITILLIMKNNSSIARNIWSNRRRGMFRDEFLKIRNPMFAIRGQLKREGEQLAAELIKSIESEINDSKSSLCRTRLDRIKKNIDYLERLSSGKALSVEQQQQLESLKKQYLTLDVLFIASCNRQKQLQDIAVKVRAWRKEFAEEGRQKFHKRNEGLIDLLNAISSVKVDFQECQTEHEYFKRVFANQLTQLKDVEVQLITRDKINLIEFLIFRVQHANMQLNTEKKETLLSPNQYKLLRLIESDLKLLQNLKAEKIEHLLEEFKMQQMEYDLNIGDHMWQCGVRLFDKSFDTKNRVFLNKCYEQLAELEMWLEKITQDQSFLPQREIVLFIQHVTRLKELSQKLKAHCDKLAKEFTATSQGMYRFHPLMKEEETKQPIVEKNLVSCSLS